MKTKKSLRLMIIFSAIFAIVLSIVPVFSSTTPRSERAEILESEGSMWDPFIEDAAVYVDEFASSVGDAVVNSMVGAFSPNFNVLLNLETGRSSIDMSRTYTSKDMYESFTIGTLYNFAKYFGIILASLLLFFNLTICIIGQAEQIRDSPLRLLAKYILSMILIQLSFNLIVEVVNFCSGMWTDFVMTDKVGTSIDFTKDFLDGIIQYNDAGGVSSILNTGISTSMSMLTYSVFFFAGIGLTWKLFKQFLRLFMEIAERYFVMILLLLFMPAVIPTLISNHTRNILISYMRMFFSQLFIMMCNAAFMKIFVYVLLQGGWTASIFNYILALAFMRICQRIDTYMLSMGLNVAQTGGGVVGSVINAGQALNYLIRGFAGNERVTSNMGNNMMNHALDTGDYNEYIQGFNLSQSSLSSDLTRSVPSELSFTQQMSQTPEIKANVEKGNALIKDAFQTGDYEKYKEGFDLTVTPFNKYTETNNVPLTETEFNNKAALKNPNLLDRKTMSVITESNTFDMAASDMKIPGSARDDLTSQGVNIDEIASIKQLDDRGTAFGFYDENGRGIGFSNNGEVETYSQRSDDLKAMQIDNAIAEDGSPSETKHIFDEAEGTSLHHQKPLMDNERILKATGEDQIIPDEYYKTQSFRTDYGTDTVSCTSYKLDSDFNMNSIGKEYEIKSVAAHPDVLKNNQYTKVKGQDGKLYGVKMTESSLKNKREYEKNPVNEYRKNKKK